MSQYQSSKLAALPMNHVNCFHSILTSDLRNLIDDLLQAMQRLYMMLMHCGTSVTLPPSNGQPAFNLMCIC